MPQLTTQHTALITGAGSGIGHSVALALAKAGYRVVLTGRRQDRLDEVAKQGGAGCHAFAADVTDADSVASLFARIANEFGRLDLLFNNAGTGAPPTPLEDLSLERWRTVLDTNLTGAFLCTQAAFRLMKSQEPRGGRIINNGSISASVPRPNMIAYTASKHAVSGLTKATSLEGRKYDIACGQIDIGNTATDMVAAMTTGTLQADMSVKVEPTFDVKHVADAVLYMAGLPLDANVLFMTITATKMPFVGRG
ncbi:MAG TPA: SDR family oxidoreductase [Steroidobacteraceae bacterium]|jgi:NAD(P)-dependent dehydrogenase (short-subunit alcohol dehydrogenase family)